MHPWAQRPVSNWFGSPIIKKLPSTPTHSSKSKPQPCGGVHPKPATGFTLPVHMVINTKLAPYPTAVYALATPTPQKKANPWFSLA
ncbi:MAG: hypothetical protein EAY75_02575 [Bacteroidetes bacterium]|nr:MAG: hypothetical protein EAY75_02575 [Bacteroidota bacterium]